MGRPNNTESVLMGRPMKEVLKAKLDEYKGRVSFLYEMMKMLDDFNDTLDAELRSEAIAVGREYGYTSQEALSQLLGSNDWITLQVAMDNLEQMRRIARKTFSLTSFGITEANRPVCQEVKFENHERTIIPAMSGSQEK